MAKDPRITASLLRGRVQDAKMIAEGDMQAYDPHTEAGAFMRGKIKAYEDVLALISSYEK